MSLECCGSRRLDDDPAAAGSEGESIYRHARPELELGRLFQGPGAVALSHVESLERGAHRVGLHRTSQCSDDSGAVSQSHIRIEGDQRVVARGQSRLRNSHLSVGRVLHPELSPHSGEMGAVDGGRSAERHPVGQVSRCQDAIDLALSVEAPAPGRSRQGERHARRIERDRVADEWGEWCEVVGGPGDP